MKKFFRNNGLSITFFFLFIFSLAGQTISGLEEHNDEIAELGAQPIGILQYLRSGHFLQATFENWESEFLQMALFLVLSMFLYQKGSSESKDPDKKEEVDREPDPKKKDAPWPVKGRLLAYGLQTFIVLRFWNSFSDVICHSLAWKSQRL